MNQYTPRLIDDYKTLKQMSSQGLVTLHRDTKRFGYVDGSHEGKSRFCFENKWYETKYFDGCFMPFVTLTKKIEGGAS